MKIGEVREKINAMGADELRALICDLYKAIPKAVKEEKDIDSLFERQTTPDGAKEKKPKKPAVDIDKLDSEIREFVDDAYDQLYFAPNRKIPKKERPKWRFKVKDYYKKLCSIPADTPEGRKAAELLGLLYRMVSHACSYYLFNTEDAFASIQIDQPDFYHSIVLQYLGGGRTEKEFKALVDLLAVDGVGRENLYSSMYPCLLNEVEPSECDMLMKTALEVQAEKLKGLPKPYRYQSGLYDKNRKASVIVEFVSRMYMRMGDIDACAVNLFENDRETYDVILYKLLNYFIDRKAEPAAWIDWYEKSVEKYKINRSDLKAMYDEVKAEQA